MDLIFRSDVSAQSIRLTGCIFTLSITSFFQSVNDLLGMGPICGAAFYSPRVVKEQLFRQPKTGDVMALGP